MGYRAKRKIGETGERGTVWRCPKSPLGTCSQANVDELPSFSSCTFVTPRIKGDQSQKQMKTTANESMLFNL